MELLVLMVVLLLLPILFSSMFDVFLVFCNLGVMYYV